MRRWIGFIAGAAAAGLIGQAMAQDFLAQRIALMKDMGGAARTLTQMSKGQVPYDAAAATAAFTKIRDHAKEMLAMFPAPPKPGEKSTAAAKVWSDPAGFKASAAKLEADATEAIKVAGTGQAALGAPLQKVGADCTACHETYRIKQ